MEKKEGSLLKYNIQILSKVECVQYSARELDDNCIIISINDSNYTTTICHNPKIKGILNLEFDDIPKTVNGLKLMTKSDTEQIKSFIDKYKQDVFDIVIHCTAGISRSGAVGCCLARYLNGDDLYLFLTGKYLPNEYIYKELCETLGLDFDLKIFNEKLRLSNQVCKEKLKSYGKLGLDLSNMFILD